MRDFLLGFSSEIAKLASHEGWGLGGEWSGGGQPTANTDSPVLHEQSTPTDVEQKTERADHFLRRRQPAEDGKITQGKLGRVPRG